MSYDLLKEVLLTPPFTTAEPVLFWGVAIAAVLLMSVAKSGFGGAIASMSAPLMLLVLLPRETLAILLPLICSPICGPSGSGAAIVAGGAVLDGAVCHYRPDRRLCVNQHHQRYHVENPDRDHCPAYRRAVLVPAENAAAKHPACDRKREVRQKQPSRAAVWCGLSGFHHSSH